MSLPKLEFTKNWTNPQDFPTFEDNEAQVRADMQLLFDQCRDGVNRLAEEVQAENIPFRRSPGIDAVTVQNALEVLRDEISGVVMGTVPDGSVTGSKLADRTVPGEKLAQSAVDGDALAEGAVTEKKLAGQAVTAQKLADGAVTEEKLADGAVTREKLAPEALRLKADLGSDGKLLPEQGAMGIVTVTASRALGLTDAGKLLQVSQGGDVTLTVPLNSTAAFPLGTEIELYRGGAGRVLLAAAEGVTLQGPASPLEVPARYARMRLKKIGVNIWTAGDCGLIADGSVTTADLANGAVTLAKTTGIQQKHTALSVSLALASWSASNTLSVSAAGVTASNTVLVSPAPASWKAWCEAGVRCTAQGAGTLTFTADSKPAAALTAQVLILN